MNNYDYFGKNTKDYSKLFTKMDIDSYKNYIDAVTKELYQNVAGRSFTYEEVANCLVATLEVPGYDLTTLEVTIEGGQLVATGTPPKDSKISPVRSVLHINADLLDVGLATATVKNGILSVSIPRKQKDASSSKVKVKFA